MLGAHCPSFTVHVLYTCNILYMTSPCPSGYNSRFISIVKWCRVQFLFFVYVVLLAVPSQYFACGHFESFMFLNVAVFPVNRFF